MTRRSSTAGLSRQLNDINNALQVTLGRLDEALDLLAVWAETYPDEGLQRMSRNLIKRCEDRS